MEFSGTTGVFIRRIQAMGIRDRPTSFRSPWQNGHVERLIGSIQRECIEASTIREKRRVRLFPRPRFSLFSVDRGLLGGVWKHGLTCVPRSDQIRSSGLSDEMDSG